jgi:hypothetical protein
VLQGGVDVTGLSVLPLTNRLGAYPLTGATFLNLYSCYNAQSNAARVTSLRNFLSWYYNGADPTAVNFDPDVAAVVENSGFHLVPVTYAVSIVEKYLTPTPLAVGSITAAAARNIRGCAGVVGGAGGGAR